MKTKSFLLISLILLSYPIQAENSQLYTRITEVSIASIQEVDNSDGTFYQLKLDISAQIYNDGEEFTENYPNTCTHHTSGEFYLNSIMDESNRIAPIIACGDAITPYTHQPGLENSSDSLTFNIPNESIETRSDIDGLVILRYTSAAPVDQEFPTEVTIMDGNITNITVKDSDIGWTEPPQTPTSGSLSLPTELLMLSLLLPVVLGKLRKSSN